MRPDLLSGPLAEADEVMADEPRSPAIDEALARLVRQIDLAVADPDDADLADLRRGIDALADRFLDAAAPRVAASDAAG